jgi:O-methyltransferase
VKAIKSLVLKTVRAAGYSIQRADIDSAHYLKLDDRYRETIAAVEPFTMTSCERIAALADATRHVVRAKIPGAMVECGVWRGGSMMVVARTLLEEGETRDLYLFDTYAGMTAPTGLDVDHSGIPAQVQFDQTKADEGSEWCFASLEDVRHNLLSTGYPEEKVHFVKGDVLDTLPHDGLGPIAILRLDTDWYESTLHELRNLYPKVSPQGFLIIDDFGYWQGCRKAVEEYFVEAGPFLSIIDEWSRLAIKPASS